MSVFGLILGVAVLIVVLSVMNGFEAELRTRVLGVVPHGAIVGRRPIADWRQLIDSFGENEQVVAAAPFTSGAGLLLANGQMEGVTITGIVPELESRVSIIGNYFTSGSLASLRAGEFGVALGEPLAARLGVGLHDRVTLVLPEASLTLAGPMPRLKRLEVVSIFAVGADVDSTLVLAHIDDVARLRRMTGGVQGIRIRTEELFRIGTTLRELLGGLDRGDFYAEAWTRRYGNLYQAIQMQKSTMFILLMMLIAVAAFNLVSSLALLVKEKRGDIAILRTMGATTSMITGIFMAHGTLIGTAGVAIGGVCGVLLGRYIGDVYLWAEAWLQLDVMSQYFVHYLPSRVDGTDVAAVCGTTFAISCTSALYPAWRAARTNPADVLRYE